MFLISSCSCLCPIQWSQVISWEWRCSWSNAGRECFNYIWVIKNFIAYYGATYIKGLTVHIYVLENPFRILWVNSLVIWWHRSGSTLAQVMACCLIAPSHYLNLSSKMFFGICLRTISPEVLMNLFCNMCLEVTVFKIIITFPTGQRVKILMLPQNLAGNWAAHLWRTPVKKS